VRSNGQRLGVSRFEVDRVVASGPDVLEMLAIMAGGHGGSAMRTTKGAAVDAMKRAGLDKDAREHWLQHFRERGFIERSPVEKLQWRRERKVIDVE